MDKILLSPPMAFIVILIATAALSFLFSKIFSFKPKKNNVSGQGEPYACGENNYDSAVSPDYSNFFAFAFFFTIAHVATLIITTIHIDFSRVLITAGLYIVAAIIGLYILMRD